MAHPRKFVEKIAIHNAKMAEETRAFEEIMKEVSGLGSSMKAPPSQHQQYRSLPNVNLGFGQNHIDLQKALLNLDNMQRPGLVDRFPVRERRYTANRTTPFPKRNFGIDTSPYHTCTAPPYLSPPQMDQGQSWRRAISDSSLHQTVIGGQLKGDMDMNKMNDVKRAGSPQSRPRSCEVPGIKMYQTEPVSPISTPQLANTGSLPDLTNLHIPSPLPTPIDADESAMSQATSPPHYQTSPRQTHVRRHTHSPVMDKQPFAPQMPYIDPNISPLELRLQQFQPYQQSPTSSSDISNQFVSHNTTVSSPTMSPTASTSMSPLLKNFPNPPLSPLATDVSTKQQQINNALQQQMQPDPFAMNFAYLGGGIQQRMQFQPQHQGIHSPNSFAQLSSRGVPDLIVTSEDEESQRLDFARELSSAMVSVGGGSASDFYNSDDPLKVELGQLDMESLQMLSGHGDTEVADQATEDQFRMDRLAGSYGFP